LLKDLSKGSFMKDRNSGRVSRRAVLSSTAVTLVGAAAAAASATTLNGPPVWKPFDVSAPDAGATEAWAFFTADEAAAVEAIVERLIPADDLSVSGKDAGCAVFIDRQLAGPFGTFERLYKQGPFREGTATQGDQSPLVPRERYRLGLAALHKYCTRTFQQPFAKLSPEQRDKILAGLETGELKLDEIDSKLFFKIVQQNTNEGFFADPIYGGNRDMVSWKMLGFPGARYDYRGYIEKHNQKIDLPPLSIAGRPEWKVKD
jgi:gluconate 2-dehydrogenase gamma chain